MVLVVMRHEQHVDRSAELLVEGTSLLTRVDQDVTPLVRRERGSLPQPLPLHGAVGASPGSRVRHITVQYYLLGHGTTLETRRLRHTEIVTAEGPLSWARSEDSDLHLQIRRSVRGVQRVRQYPYPQASVHP